MASINVQFSDAKQTVICAYFDCPQDPVSYPNQGQIDTKDPRYATFYNNQSTEFQVYLPNPA